MANAEPDLERSRPMSETGTDNEIELVVRGKTRIAEGVIELALASRAGEELGV